VHERAPVELRQPAIGANPDVATLAAADAQHDGLALAGGERRRLERRHSLRPVSVRVYRSGTHEVDLRVNGEIVARARFELRA
jgi:hypothetical protein